MVVGTENSRRINGIITKIVSSLGKIRYSNSASISDYGRRNASPPRRILPSLDEGGYESPGVNLSITTILIKQSQNSMFIMRVQYTYRRSM
jgi:hypothetical protein